MKIESLGVDLSGLYTREELESIEISFAASEGEIGLGSLPLPDAAGSLTLWAGQQLKLSQGGTTVLDGFAGDMERTRGSVVTAPGRLESVGIVDENAMLYGVRAYHWKRPAETDRARILAFKTKFLPFWLDTSMVLNTNLKTLQKRTYTTDTLLAELMSHMQAATGKTIFIEGHRLHWHLPTEGDAATLAIHDTTYDYVNVFPPMEGSAHRLKDPSELGVNFLAYNSKGERVVKADAISYARHDTSGVRHFKLLSFPDATLSQLTTQAAGALASSKDERITYECEIGPLTVAQVRQIPVGSLVNVTSQVFGLTNSTQRVAYIKLRYRHPGLFFARLSFGYPVRIRRTAKPTVFPDLKPFAGTPAVTGVFTLTSIAGSVSAAHVTVAVGQWVYIQEISRTAGGPFAAQILYLWGTTPTVGPLRSVAGVPNGSTTVFDWVSPTDPPPAGVVTPELTYGVWRGYDFFFANNPTYVPGVPFEPLAPGGAWQCTQAWIDLGPNVGAPSFELYLRADSWGGSVPYDVTVTLVVSDLPPEALAEETPVGDPLEPGSGQPVTGEGALGNGSTTTFTTAFPYAPLSLHVWVDGVRIIVDLTETDPAAGTFTLAFAPLGAVGDSPAERITWEYLAA